MYLSSSKNGKNDKASAFAFKTFKIQYKKQYTSLYQICLIYNFYTEFLFVDDMYPRFE